MRLARFAVAALPLVALAALAAPARAQSAASLAGTPARGGRGLSLSPYIGLHVPMLDLVKQGVAGASGDAAGSAELRQQVSITFGGRLGLWPSERFGIETDVGYTPGNLTFTENGVATDRTSRILTGSAKLVVRVLPVRSFFNLSLSGGVGAVNHRTGTASTASVATTENVTDLGGVVGASARLRLGRILSLTAGAEDYLYHATIDKVAQTKSERLQHDVRFSFGVGLPFFGM